MSRLHWHHGPAFDGRGHVHHPVELLGALVMVVAGVTIVSVAIADASFIGARLRGDDTSDRDMWLGSFAVALATLVLGAVAHAGRAAARSVAARTAYAVAAAGNAIVALAVTLPADVSAALPAQHMLASVILAWLSISARPA